MKILILGGGGMLGHRLWHFFSQSHETWATLRGTAHTLPSIFDRTHVCEQVDAQRFETVKRAFHQVQPDIVVNCVGLIKQREAAHDTLLMIDINSRFPHQLAALCADTGSRLIHISTDCVFSGQKGFYSEADPVDAQDVYGRTKALGEVVDQPHVLTVRTSLIGRELATHYGLVEWFLAQRERVTGYQKAIFSGFPTITIAQILRDEILPRPGLGGLYHVSAEPISKYDLLGLVNEAYRCHMEILPDTTVNIDRSLDSSRFRAITGFAPPSWPSMIEAMASDPFPYPKARTS